MDKLIYTTYYFEGIDCPNCASKIERALNKEDRIISVNINFINQKIVVEHAQKDDVFELVLSICQKVEQDVKLYKNRPKKMYINHNHSHRYDDICIDNNCVRENLAKKYFPLLGIVLAIAALTLQIFDRFFVIRTVFFVGSYLILARKLLLKCLNAFKHKDIFNENTLMVIASVGALCIGESIEAIMIVILNSIGEHYQNKAIKHTKSSIEDLIEDDNSKVTLSSLKEVFPDQVKVGDVIIIKPGEKVLLDGILLSSSAVLDMKSLTGESLPVNRNKDEEILSGSINFDKVIEIKVTKEYQESTISKVKKLIEEANDKKAKSQIFITKFARIYTPIIILAALCVFFIKYFAFEDLLINALNSMFSILVIACPCALVISIPLCYFSSIGACSKKGVLVKGGNYLETLTNVDTFIFDKTGTLTKGNFVVKKIISNNEEELLDIINKVELHSSHPIALAIRNYYKKEINVSNESEYIEYSGKGIVLKENTHTYCAGNSSLLKEFNIAFEEVNESGTLVYVSKDNECLGYVILDDEIKEESKELLEYLKKNNYTTYLLSGDRKKSVDNVGDYLQIDNLYHSLLPHEKYSIVEKIKKEGNKIVYVGDGINDSPSLKISDVGISMGSMGADISKECADIIIVNDDISKIIDVIKISKFTKKVVIENIIMILFVKLVAIIIGASGILGSLAMFLSIFADVGVCLLSILNTLRILKSKKCRNK